MTWNLKTELDVGGTWTDITDVAGRAASAYIVGRGRRSEGSTADASAFGLTLDNRNGDFTLDNPLGNYYGLIGRNSQIRTSLPAQRTRLITPGTGTDGVTAPDHSRLDITGDIEIRVDVWLASWRRNTDLIGKWTETGNQRSIAFWVGDDGRLYFYWSPDGSSSIGVASGAVVPLPVTGRKVPMVTLDVNNGSGGYTVTFYMADSLTDSSPVQLDDAYVTTSGTTSIYSSSAIAYIGYHSVVTYGRWYGARILDGIGGSAAADPDFTTQTDLDSSFADSAGNTWTVQGDAYLDGRQWLFTGEVPDWPESSDTSGNDATVEVQAAGVMRRLGSNSMELRSCYYRGHTSSVAPVTDLVAYWSLEGSPESAIGGPSTVVQGDIKWDSDSTSFRCSAPLPDVNGGYLGGVVPNYVSTGEIQVRMLLAIASTGTANNVVIMSVRCGGTAVRWEIVYTTGGGLTLYAYNASGSTLLTDGPYSFGLNGKPVRLTLMLEQNGSDVDYTFGTLEPGLTIGASPNGTLSSNTITKATQVVIDPTLNGSDMTVGHITVQSAVGSIFDLDDLLDAYDGETAGDRFARLCTEEEIDYRVIGDVGTADVMMGYQPQGTLLTLLREVETTGCGLLYEPADFLGLEYRTNRSLVNQSAVVTLDHDAGDLSTFRPITDDRGVVNDLTLSRANGGKYRYVKESGDQSTAAPPAGAGVYQSSATVNCPADDALPNLASWKVNLGTCPDARFPGLAVELARATFTNDQDLLTAITELNIGDPVDITNLTDVNRYDDITQLVFGWVIRIDNFSYLITLMCTPSRPYQVMVWDSSASLYSSHGSTLSSGISSSATSMSVATSTGQLWDTSASGFDIRMGGERITVGSVSGSSSPQTFGSLTRSVNGVVKAHSAGVAIRLFDERRWAL